MRTIEKTGASQLSSTSALWLEEKVLSLKEAMVTESMVKSASEERAQLDTEQASKIKYSDYSLRFGIALFFAFLVLLCIDVPTNHNPAVYQGYPWLANFVEQSLWTVNWSIFSASLYFAFYLTNEFLSDIDALKQKHRAEGVLSFDASVFKETERAIDTLTEATLDNLSELITIVKAGDRGLAFDGGLLVSFSALCAELGDPDAAYEISQQYKDNDGWVKKNENAQLQWLRVASELGSMKAFKELAEMQAPPAQSNTSSGMGGFAVGLLVGNILSK
jgi:hypothetical protein